MNRKLQKIGLAIMLLSALGQLNAQLNVYDGVNGDPLVNTDGIGWSVGTPWVHDSGSSVVYHASSLEYPTGFGSGGNNGSIRLFGANKISRLTLDAHELFNTEFYISFLVTKNALGSFEFHGNYDSNSSITNSRLGLKVTASGQIDARSSTQWSSDNPVDATNFTSADGVFENDTTYLVVLRKTSGHVLVGIYKEGDAVPSSYFSEDANWISRTNSTTSVDIDTFVFHCTSGNVYIDEFIMGDTFNDVVTASGVLGLSSKEYIQDFQMYPNPATDIVTINTSKISSKNLTIKICDLTGKNIYTKRVEDRNDDVVSLAVSSFSKGVYIVQIEGENVIQTSKLLVK